MSKDGDLDLDKLDIDGDGHISELDLKTRKDILDINRQEKKAETQKKIAVIAMGNMIVVTAFLLLGDISTERLTALVEPLGWFYISQASIVGAYFGFTTWMSKG